MRNSRRRRRSRQALGCRHIDSAEGCPRIRRGFLHDVRPARQMHDRLHILQGVCQRIIRDTGEIAYRHHVRPRDCIRRKCAHQSAKLPAGYAKMSAGRTSRKAIGARDRNEAAWIQNHFQP